MKEKILSNAKLTKFVANIWPPFLLSGIKVIDLSQNYQYCKVRLKSLPLTKNINGTIFGGSLFSMTDPIYSIMLTGILGQNYYIWDKSAFIDFISPAVGAVFAEFKISDEIKDKIIKETINGDKYFPEFNCQIKDKSNKLIANVNKKLYIKLKHQFRKKS